ncbi:hypothetical protein KKG29_04285 [Patescibacteria group bacterium]|nr:hypothetical protein [Patescibacteria group bacterium]MBU4338796.1 hypothetical protein [Patescibacteria group bacterium]MBU4580645.1 hypothetical protein [Patescibacteria group bacterium]
MSFNTKKLKRGSRVLTRNGPGELVSCGGMGVGVGVELDRPWAGSKFVFFGEAEEIVVESNFTLVRIINLGSLAPRLIAGAQNYLSWDECRNALEEPFALNETLVALNFEKRILESNRRLGNADLYQILETGLSIYQPAEAKLYSSLKKAEEAWKKNIDALSGTSGDILLCALLDLENKRILAKAVFAATQVVSKEIF